MEIKIVKGTVEEYKAKLESIKNANDAVKNIHNNTIYFIYEVDGSSKPISNSGRIYIGDTEFSRPTECLKDLTFIAGDSSVETIKKNDI